MNAEESLYQLFQVSLNNPEAIWQTSKNSWGDVGGEGRERRCTPRAIYSGFGCVGVLQEAIDDFYMNDGRVFTSQGFIQKKALVKMAFLICIRIANHVFIRP